MSKIETALGNTESQAPKGGVSSIIEEKSKIQTLQKNYWAFTLVNYTEEEVEAIEQIGKHECDWYVFQEEICPESGSPHLQGQLKLKNKQRMTSLKKWNDRIHWEETKKITASIAYCSRETKRKPGGRIFTRGIEIPEQIELEEPYGWQLEVLEIIKTKPDKRTIHWFWEKEGHMGKTILAKYLVVKHNALILSGKSSDMYQMLNKYPDKRKLIVCNVPRSAQDYINYGALEQIKDGLVFSGKYEGAQIVFNCPHVFVFANEPPDETKMSRDRFHIVNIRESNKIELPE